MSNSNPNTPPKDAFSLFPDEFPTSEYSSSVITTTPDSPRTHNYIYDGKSAGLRLISLTANQTSFHSVHFNRKGVNLIVARQQDPQSSKRGKTYNGVGKSLLIAIIHFCLGASFIEDWKTKMASWEWTLEFEIGGKNYHARRSVEKHKLITLDEVEFTVDKFNQWLQETLMNLSRKVSHLTFRPFLKRFIRPARESYNDWRRVHKQETPFQSQVVNAYLLGLDLDLVARKNELKLEKDRAAQQLQTQKKDEFYQEYFGQPGTVDVQIQFLEVRIEALRKNLASLTVAEDYYDIQKQANEAQRELQDLRNKLVITRNQIENLQRNYKETSDIAPDTVRALYEEVNISFPQQVTKQIQDILQFHSQLIENHRVRVEKETEKLINKEKELEKSIDAKSREMNRHLAYLNAHGALDEHVKLTQQLAGFEERKQRLTAGREFHENTNKALRRVERESLEESERTEAHLKQSNLPHLRAIDVFQSLVRRFYPDKPCGLSVTPNTGDNTTRFDIDAFIQDDPSDGINHIKIFCYDMTTLEVRPSPGVDFVFHDSRIFDGVDSRQVSILLETALKVTYESDKQYIVSINENTLKDARAYWQKEANEPWLQELEGFDEFVQKHQILELTDASDEDRLLGVQVDISYEAKG